MAALSLGTSRSYITFHTINHRSRHETSPFTLHHSGMIGVKGIYTLRWLCKGPVHGFRILATFFKKPSTPSHTPTSYISSHLTDYLIFWGFTYGNGEKVSYTFGRVEGGREGLCKVGLIFYGQNCRYYSRESKFIFGNKAIEFVYGASAFGLYSCGSQSQLFTKMI